MDFELVFNILMYCGVLVVVFLVHVIVKIWKGSINVKHAIDLYASFALYAFFLELFFGLFLCASNTLNILNVFVEQKTVYWMLGVPAGLFAVFFVTAHILSFLSPKQQ